jgi:hypothetical protein
MAHKTRGVEIVESQELKHLLEEFPDFLTRCTSEEHAFIEWCQEERWKQHVPDDWWGGGDEDNRR